MIGLVAAVTSAGLVASAWLWANRPWESRTKPFEDDEPRWEAYLTEERGKPAAVLVDLYWHRHEARHQLTEAMWVIVDMEHAGRYGVGTADEADRIARAEQDLLDQLLGQCDTVFVGRMRAQGTWRLLFMSPPGQDAVSVAAHVLGDAGLGTFRCLSTHDPDWRAYRRCLAPDPERLQSIENARTFNALASAGEPVGIERAIEHRIAFSDDHASRRFAELASLYGFDVQHVDRGRDVVVHIVREDVVDLERVHAVVMELSHLARSCNGTYDGWSCPRAAAA